jgi:hypothetical protein
MPLKIGDADSSRALVPKVKYTSTPSGLSQDTRADESVVQWSIAVTGGVTYLIKFSANFFKKHLHTSTKKLANVQVEYDKLATIVDDDARWRAAQDLADETKFLKQLGHRSRDEQDCGKPGCGHSIKEHKVPGSCSKVTTLLEFPTGYKPGDKLPNGQPIKKGPVARACPCTGYAPAYAEKRGLQGKPSLNPLEGATATANDLIWMDKIPRATFEKVIQTALQKRFADVMPIPGWNSAGEHIEWDFGAANRGCILKFDTKTKIADAKAQQFSSVEVTMTLDNTDPKNPVFTACHLDGKKTK